MFHTSCIELSRSALRKNLRFLRKRIGPTARFCSVIKGNAYGHGISAMVPLVESCGVRQFAVSSADEALEAFNARTARSDIMIMTAIDNDVVGWAVENGVSFYVFELERLEAALLASRKLSVPARVHLELETGFHRTGFDLPELQLAVELIRANPENLVVEGVCTHYAGSESVGNYLRVQRQIQSFNQQCEWLSKQNISCGLRHTACSAAAITYPETIMDMVRIGIAHYGYWPSKETQMNFVLHEHEKGTSRKAEPIRRVLRWKSRVISLKDVPAGEFIGYGTSYLTTRSQRVACIPVGYAHGFARTLSNAGHVLIHGRRAPVVGIVNMNMMTVDVTDIPGVKAGDEVVLIGGQKNRSITVSSFSDMTRFLNYEILVRLPEDIPRVVVD